jgi:hypothetical protein
MACWTPLRPSVAPRARPGTRTRIVQDPLTLPVTCGDVVSPTPHVQQSGKGLVDAVAGHVAAGQSAVLHGGDDGRALGLEEPATAQGHGELLGDGGCGDRPPPVTYAAGQVLGSPPMVARTALAPGATTARDARERGVLCCRGDEGDIQGSLTRSQMGHELLALTFDALLSALSRSTSDGPGRRQRGVPLARRGAAIGTPSRLEFWLQGDRTAGLMRVKVSGKLPIANRVTCGGCLVKLPSRVAARPRPSMRDRPGSREAA